MKISTFLSIFMTFQVILCQVVFPDDPITTKRTSVTSTKVQATVPNSTIATTSSTSTTSQTTIKTTSPTTVSTTSSSSTTVKATTSLPTTVPSTTASSTTSTKLSTISPTTILTTTAKILTTPTIPTLPTSPLTTTVKLSGSTTTTTTRLPPTGAKSFTLSVSITTEETEEEQTESPESETEPEETEETEPENGASAGNVTICAALGQCQKISGNAVFDSNRMDVRINNSGAKQNANLTLGSMQKLTTPAKLGTPTLIQNQYSCQYLNMTESCNLPQGMRCGIQFDPVPYAPSKNGYAKYNAYPWQGLVMNNDPKDKFTYFASGALLDHKHFLTTASSMAQFLYQEHKIKVRFGDWNLASTIEPFPYQEFEVDQIILHDKFDPNTFENNIAILKLNPRVPLGEFPTISHVCLPSNDLTIYNLRCVVSGFGKDNKNADTNFIIRDIDMPILNSTYCQSALRKSILGSNYILSDSWICAGGEIGKSTCDGDGGDPLVCNIAGQFYVVGLASWAPIDQNCGEKPIPELYVNVFKYLPWIQYITSGYQGPSRSPYSHGMVGKSANAPKLTTKANGVQKRNGMTERNGNNVATGTKKAATNLTTKKNIEKTSKKSETTKKSNHNVAKNAATKISSTTKQKNQTAKATSSTTKKMSMKQ